MVVRKAKPVIALAVASVLALAALATANTDGTASVTAAWNDTLKGIVVNVSVPVGGTYGVFRQDNAGGPWVRIRSLSTTVGGAVIMDQNTAPGLNYRYQVRALKDVGDGMEWLTLADSGWATGNVPQAAPPNIHADRNWGLFLPMDDRQYEVGISADGGRTWTTKTVTSTFGPTPIGPSDIPPNAQIRVRVAGNNRNQYAYTFCP